MSSSYFSSQGLYTIIIDWILKRAIGPFIDGPLNTNSNTEGPIELKNLLIKKDIIERLTKNNLPITIEEGLVGEILLDIPAISQLIFNSNEPIQIEIKDVYILLVDRRYDQNPKSHSDLPDILKAELAIQEYKAKILSHMEEQFFGQDPKNSKSGSWFSFSSISNRASDIAARVADRLQFRFSNLHVRVLINTNYVFGFKIEELLCRNTNEVWNPNRGKTATHQSNDIEHGSYKLLEMKDLSCYWHGIDELDKEFLEYENNKEKENQNERRNPLEIKNYFTDKSLLKNYQGNYLLEPVYAQCRILRRMTKQILEEKSRIEVSLLFTKIKCSLAYKQYQEILKVGNYLSTVQKRKKYRILRPDRSIIINHNDTELTKSWWKWATYHLSKKSRLKNTNNSSIIQKAKENNLYAKLYKEKLNLGKHGKLEESTLATLKQIEQKRSLEELSVLRKAIYRKLNGDIFDIDSTMDSTTMNSSDPIDLSEIENIDANSDKTFIKSCVNVETCVLALKFDGMNLVNQASMSNYLIQDQTFTFEKLFASYQIRNRTKSSIFNLALYDMGLNNGILNFKDNRTYFNDMVKKIGYLAVLNEMKSHWSGENFNSLHSLELRDFRDRLNILQLSCLSLKDKMEVSYSALPMKIYYNKTVIKMIQKFFKPKKIIGSSGERSSTMNDIGIKENNAQKNITLDLIDTLFEETDPEELIRQKQEIMRNKARNQLMNKWREMTEGGSPLPLSIGIKNLQLSIMILAPHVVIPSIDTETELHIDLGFWRIKNFDEKENEIGITSRSHARSQDSLCTNENEDSNQTEFWTPPEGHSQSDSTDMLHHEAGAHKTMHSDQNYYKTALQNKLNRMDSHGHYDKYNLKIEGLQSTIGGRNLPWTKILNGSSSTGSSDQSRYHILNRISFNLDLKRQMILYYKDSAWLEFTGDLEEFVLNLSIEKAMQLQKCINNMTEQIDLKSIDSMNASGRTSTTEKGNNNTDMTDWFGYKRGTHKDENELAYNELDDHEKANLDNIKEERQASIEFNVNKFAINLDIGGSSILNSKKYANVPRNICSMKFEKLNGIFIKKPFSGKALFNTDLFILEDQSQNYLMKIDGGINSDMTWYKSSSPDLRDKPDGVSYQITNITLPRIDVFFNPVTWAESASAADEISKSFGDTNDQDAKPDEETIDKKRTEEDVQPQVNTAVSATPSTSDSDFNFKIANLNIHMTRMLKTGPFKGQIQHICQFTMSNMTSNVSMDHQNSILLTCQITSMIADDLTHANLSAAARSWTLPETAKTDKYSENPYKKARIFTFGKIETSDYLNNENSAFHYIYPDRSENEVEGKSDAKNILAIQIDMTKIANKETATINIGNIKYMHSARFVTEMFDCSVQFEENWNEILSKKRKDQMREYVANRISQLRRPSYAVSDERESPEVFITKRGKEEQTTNEQDITINMCSPVLCQPMTGFADRINIGNNQYSMMCPGHMLITNIKNTSGQNIDPDETPLFNVSMTTMNVYSLVIKKDTKADIPILLPKVKITNNINMRMVISSFKYHIPSDQDHVKRNYSCEQGDSGMKCSIRFDSKISIFMTKLIFEKLMTSANSGVFYPDEEIDSVYGASKLTAKPIVNPAAEYRASTSSISRTSRGSHLKAGLKEQRRSSLAPLLEIIHSHHSRSNSNTSTSSDLEITNKPVHMPLKAEINIAVELQLYQIHDNITQNLAKVVLPKMTVNYLKDLSYYQTFNFQMSGMTILEQEEDASSTRNSKVMESEHEFSMRVQLIDRNAPEYATVYNNYSRFVKVCMKKITTKINLKTFIKICDFFSVGTQSELVKQRQASQDLKTKSDLEVEDDESTNDDFYNNKIELDIEQVYVEMNKEEYTLASMVMDGVLGVNDTFNNVTGFVGGFGSAMQIFEIFFIFYKSECHQVATQNNFLFNNKLSEKLSN